MIGLRVTVIVAVAVALFRIAQNRSVLTRLAFFLQSEELHAHHLLFWDQKSKFTGPEILSRIEKKISEEFDLDPWRTQWKFV